MIHKIFHQSRYFLWLYLVTILGCVFILMYFSKSDIHLWINKHNSFLADVFFHYFTHLGDGVVIIGISILFLFWKYGYSLLLFSSYLISSLFAQIIKHFICPLAARPKAYFGNSVALHFVDGVKIHLLHSFPSGHTTTAFAFFLTLSFITKNKWLQILFFVMALLVGYSRMYLSQHFLIDVFSGSIIGVIVAFFVSYINEKNRKDWMDKGILTCP